MIPLQRVAIPAPAQDLLNRWTQRFADDGATAAAERERWHAAEAPKKHVRAALESMARGAVRCMYCDDSRGTDIDHFEPLDSAPLRAFVWLNHLLACSFCNSNVIRHQYPVTAEGACLLRRRRPHHRRPPPGTASPSVPGPRCPASRSRPGSGSPANHAAAPTPSADPPQTVAQGPPTEAPCDNMGLGDKPGCYRLGARCLRVRHAVHRSRLPCRRTRVETPLG